MRRRQRDHDNERVAVMGELARVVTLLSWRMQRLQATPAGAGVPAARRRLLDQLIATGPQSVPQLARSRAVSRQHLHSLTAELLAGGLVELRDNPVHRRSRLVAVTRAGRALAEAAGRREASLVSKLAPDLALEDVRAACRVLAALEAALAG